MKVFKVLFALALVADSQAASDGRIGVSGGLVREDAGGIDLSVDRSGDTSTALTVECVTLANGTAVPGVNFVPTHRTISFTKGERQSLFHIPILNDGRVNRDGGTTFGVYLTNAPAGVNVQTDSVVVVVEDIQWPTTLDLSYVFPVEAGSYSWRSAPNGKLVGYNDRELVYVNADDTVGGAFPLVLDGMPSQLLVESDGKVLVVDHGERTRGPDGSIALYRPPFSKVNGFPAPRPGFARLNRDGSLDRGFLPATVPADFIRTLADGRILIFDGTSLLALEPSGEIDLSFHPDPRIPSPGSLAEDPEGKLIIAAGFSPQNGTTGFTIFRLNQNGAFDPTFSPTAVEEDIVDILRQTDGKILIVGSFGLVRLKSNGMLDETFKADLDYPVGGAILDGDHILITAQGWAYNSFIRRLKRDGSLDKDFPFRMMGGDFHPRVNGMTLQNGKLRVEGAFEAVNGLRRRRIVRLLLDDVPESEAVIAPALSDQVRADDWKEGFEGMAEAKITVRRLGDVRGSAAINYKARDGSAEAGKDYTAVSGTLSFGSFEMEKSFQLPVLDDSEFEPDETVQLVLSVGNGAAVGPPTSFIIHDDEVRIRTLSKQDLGLDLVFNGVPGEQYSVEGSSDLMTWQTLADSSASTYLANERYLRRFVELDRFRSAPYRFFRIKRGL